MDGYLKKHKENEIIFDMPFGNDQDLPIINELNLNYAIFHHYQSYEEYHDSFHSIHNFHKNSDN